MPINITSHKATSPQIQNWHTVSLNSVHYIFFSIGGLNPVENMMAYCMSKAALDMVTKQFALELGRQQIRVNSVNLTGVLTERVVRALPDSSMLQGLKAATPIGRFCTLKKVLILSCTS